MKVGKLLTHLGIGGETLVGVRTRALRARDALLVLFKQLHQVSLLHHDLLLAIHKEFVKLSKLIRQLLDEDLLGVRQILEARGRPSRPLFHRYILQHALQEFIIQKLRTSRARNRHRRQSSRRSRLVRRPPESENIPPRH